MVDSCWRSRLGCLTGKLQPRLCRRFTSAWCVQDDFVEFQEVLHSSVHDALRHAVGAAAHDQQPSLLGVAYAITLLRLLHGQPAFAERQASWQRLADRFPPPLRQELTPAHFVPPDQEAMGVGLLDME